MLFTQPITTLLLHDCETTVPCDRSRRLCCIVRYQFDRADQPGGSVQCSTSAWALADLVVDSLIDSRRCASTVYRPSLPWAIGVVNYLSTIGRRSPGDRLPCIVYFVRKCLIYVLSGTFWIVSILVRFRTHCCRVLSADTDTLTQNVFVLIQMSVYSTGHSARLRTTQTQLVPHDDAG